MAAVSQMWVKKSNKWVEIICPPATGYPYLIWASYDVSYVGEYEIWLKRTNKWVASAGVWVKRSNKWVKV